MKVRFLVPGSIFYSEYGSLGKRFYNNVVYDIPDEYALEQWFKERYHLGEFEIIGWDNQDLSLVLHKEAVEEGFSGESSNYKVEIDSSIAFPFTIRQLEPGKFLESVTVSVLDIITPSNFTFSIGFPSDHNKIVSIGDVDCSSVDSGNYFYSGKKITSVETLAVYSSMQISSGSLLILYKYY